MVLLPVGPYPRWRLAAILSKNSKWHNSVLHKIRDMMSSSVVGLSGTADLTVKFSVSENPRWRLVTILDMLKWSLLHSYWPIDAISGSRVGFSGMVDLMMKLSVSENARWRPAAILDQLK